MSGRNGQELLSTWVPAELAEAFKAQARTSDGGTSAALRRLVAEAVDPASPPTAPRGVGCGEQVSVRFKPPERAALAAAAETHGTSPAAWLRSLALVHLTGRPQWNPTELDALRDVFRELRAIGNNVNQIAHALNMAAQAGIHSPGQGDAAREAAELVRVEMRRIGALVTANLASWGLPVAGPSYETDSQPKTFAEAAQAPRRRRIRKRPGRFERAEANSAATAASSGDRD